MKILKLLLKPFGQKSDRERAMSIIEIIIVIALIGGIMSVIVTNVIQQADNAQIDTTKIAMQRVGQKLTMFRVDNSRYPSTEQGLDALVTDPGDARRWRGPYIEEEKLVDPWGTSYDYESDGRSYRITSAGPDQATGTEDDFSYPEAKVEE